MKKIFLIVIILCTVMTAVSCGEKHDENTVVIIGGHDVTRDEYEYFYINTKADLGTDIDNKALTDKVLATLKRHYAVYSLAEKYDLKLTKEMKDAVNEKIEETIDSFGGENEYNNQLSMNYMTGDIYREILEIEQLEIALREYLFNEFTSDIDADDEAVEADFNANFVRATHILIVHNNGFTDKENRELAEELRNRITNGEDFTDLQKEYGQDIGIDYTNGYYLTQGLYNETFEDTAYSLGIDEISGVVESSVGFHIIKRMPLDINYLYNNFEDIRYIYKNRVVNERLDADAETLSVEYTELYDEINK